MTTRDLGSPKIALPFVLFLGLMEPASKHQNFAVNFVVSSVVIVVNSRHWHYYYYEPFVIVLNLLYLETSRMNWIDLINFLRLFLLI